jgi:hypothetical protein
MNRWEPTLQHTAFAVPDLHFSERQKSELARCGVSHVIKPLENVVSELKGFYQTNPPTLRDQHARLKAAYKALATCSGALQKDVDDLTASNLSAGARSRTGFEFREFYQVLEAYGEAAREAADRLKQRKKERGPEADRDNHIAVAVGAVLREGNVSLGKGTKGPFVIALRIVFEVLNIHKADPRNDAGRALQILEKTI